MAKVLVVAPYVPHPARHGGAIRSRVLLDALRTDHEVHLAAAVESEADRDHARGLTDATGIAVHALAARSAAGVAVGSKLVAWATGRSELAGRRWAQEAQAQVRDLERRHGPFLRVVDSTFALPVCESPCDVLFLHNLEHALLARPDAVRRTLTERISRAVEASLLRRLERRAIAAARALTITVSSLDRQAALALVPGARVEVVPNTVDTERLVPLPPPGAASGPRLLFVGAFDYPPNVEAVTELVLRHLPVLRATWPQLTVRLVGRDPSGALRRFAGTRGVEIVGGVDDVVPHYRDVHAVFLPLRSGGGTRLKILEAWALGVPVLSTAVGCEGLPARDGEHLRGFETPEQGAAALRDVLADPGPLRRRGRELVEREFGHAAAIARLRELFATAAR